MHYTHMGKNMRSRAWWRHWPPGFRGAAGVEQTLAAGFARGEWASAAGCPQAFLCRAGSPRSGTRALPGGASAAVSYHRSRPGPRTHLLSGRKHAVLDLRFHALSVPLRLWTIVEMWQDWRRCGGPRRRWCSSSLLRRRVRCRAGGGRPRGRGRTRAKSRDAGYLRESRSLPASAGRGGPGGLYRATRDWSPTANQALVGGLLLAHFATIPRWRWPPAARPASAPSCHAAERAAYDFELKPRYAGVESLNGSCPRPHRCSGPISFWRNRPRRTHNARIGVAMTAELAPAAELHLLTYRNCRLARRSQVTLSRSSPRRA